LLRAAAAKRVLLWRYFHRLSTASLAVPPQADFNHFFGIFEQTLGSPKRIFNQTFLP
jgi:hypothetical protein